jgi:hypothetical protein
MAAQAAIHASLGNRDASRNVCRFSPCALVSKSAN